MTWLRTSEKTKSAGLDGSTMAAKDDVMTTLLTVGALLLMAWRSPTVPLTAELMELAGVCDGQSSFLDRNDYSPGTKRSV
jgi:hypothetical protein